MLKLDKKEDTAFNDIKKRIGDLATLEGIYGVLLFRIDALLLHLHISTSLSQELLRLMVWLKNIIFKVSEELKEDIDGVTYSKENFSVYFYKIGNAGILSVIVDSYANEGLLSIEMDKYATLIKEQFIIDEFGTGA